MTPDGQTLVRQHKNRIANMNKAFEAAGKAGMAHVKLKEEYSVELAKVSAKLHDSGIPAAMVRTQAAGDPTIAALALKMDIEKQKQKLYRDRGFAYKAEADAIKEQMKIEWNTV